MTLNVKANSSNEIRNPTNGGIRRSIGYDETRNDPNDRARNGKYEKPAQFMRTEMITNAGNKDESGSADVADDVKNSKPAVRILRSSEDKNIKKGMVNHHTQNADSTNGIQ